MSITPLSTIPILQFINTVKSADAGKQREIRMDIESAKTLAFTLGMVMARLEGDMEQQISKIMSEKSTSTEILSVKLDGGNNW